MADIDEIGIEEGEKDIILALDIGTTNIKVAAIDTSGSIIRIKYEPLKLVTPQPDWYEICPNQLWEDVLSLINTVSEGLENRILCVGLSTQRGTFITWDKDTGEYLHNFITWLDKRTAQMCSDWNESFLIRNGKALLNMVGKVIGSRHAICAANFNVQASNVQMRLKWVMMNIPKATELYKKSKLSFGTVDTWILYKFTGGNTFATDYTLAGGTGIYDIWGSKWCPIMTWMFGNPLHALPEVRDSNAYYGDVSAEIGLRFTAPVWGVLGDQQASVIGNRIFKKGDVKLTLGTSLFCNIVTDNDIHPVATALYPQIAWKLKDQDACYMAETSIFASGKSLNWVVESGLLDKIENADEVAESVTTSGGVCYTGLSDYSSYPDSADKSYRGMVGITSTTKTPHLVRAVLEYQVFSVKAVLDRMFEFYSEKPDVIYVDGGASKSKFIMENITRLCESDTQRYSHGEGSLMGTFYVAGLGIGIFKSLEDIDNLALQEGSLFPFDREEDVSCLKDSYEKWCDVMHTI